MVVRLSALRTGRFYLKEILPVLISVRGWVDPRFIVRSEGFYVNEKSIDTSWVEQICNNYYFCVCCLVWTPLWNASAAVRGHSDCANNVMSRFVGGSTGQQEMIDCYLVFPVSRVFFRFNSWPVWGKNKKKHWETLFIMTAVQYVVFLCPEVHDERLKAFTGLPV